MGDGEIDWDRLITEYRDGATFVQLGQRWGRKPDAIREALIRAGVELEDRQARIARGLAAYQARQRAELADRDARVVEVYLAGHTVAETAKLTGVQPTQVGRIVKRAGVSRRRGQVPKPAADRIEPRPLDRTAAVYVAAPARGAVCCRCDHPIAGGAPAVSVRGLDGRGLAHTDCVSSAEHP